MIFKLWSRRLTMELPSKTSRTNSESKSSNMARESNDSSTSSDQGVTQTSSPRFSSTGVTLELGKRARPRRSSQMPISSPSPTKMETSGGTDTRVKKPSSLTSSMDGFHTTLSCGCATAIRIASPTREVTINSKLRALYSRLTSRGKNGIPTSTTSQPSNAESKNSGKLHTSKD